VTKNVDTDTMILLVAATQLKVSDFSEKKIPLMVTPI